jgi:hypothetical protein
MSGQAARSQQQDEQEQTLVGEMCASPHDGSSTGVSHVVPARASVAT